ncbi:MAG: hemerythrin domain-containing protein, partial [Planctomycetia bacterium]|nr:hemerythrin domain-containing protein [Planctomycetia bacterium]
LLRDHQELNRELRTVQSLLHKETEPSDVQHAAAAAAELKALRARLARHFTEEEQGGCIEEAVCRQPQLAGRARELEKQHPELLAELDRIIGLVDRPQPVPPAALARFDAFLRTLLTHEAEENRIVSQGFNLCEASEEGEIVFDEGDSARLAS